ncbi:MAG: aminopeptidase [Candidatus Binatia bacterium]
MRSLTSTPVLQYSITPFLLLCLLSGCSPFYLFSVALEEGRILWRRQPIEILLAQPDLQPEMREKLRLVLAAREYARASLDLRVRGSYASYSYVDREVLSYVLMAAPKTELEPYTWWYFLVGSFPYKGFASKEAAKAQAERFENDGYDTYIRTTSAYSTLGWFDDPLLAHLLKYDSVTLVEVIFHELLHNTLFVKSAVDFNESLANFVGNRAAIDFFRIQRGEGSAEYRKAVRHWEEDLEFSVFLRDVASALRSLYSQDIGDDEKISRREEVFSASQKEWAKRISDRPAHRHRGYAGKKLNNAVIAHYLLYLKDLDLFEALYIRQAKDLRRSLEVIKNRLAQTEDPFEAVVETGQTLSGTRFFARAG